MSFTYAWRVGDWLFLLVDGGCIPIWHDGSRASIYMVLSCSYFGDIPTLVLGNSYFGAWPMLAACFPSGMMVPCSWQCMVMLQVSPYLGCNRETLDNVEYCSCLLNYLGCRMGGQGGGLPLSHGHVPQAGVLLAWCMVLSLAPSLGLLGWDGHMDEASFSSFLQPAT